MKNLIILLAALGVVGIAVAQTATSRTTADAAAQFITLDSDKNGVLSFEEIAVKFPNLSAQAFVDVDTDTSSDLNEKEFTALWAQMNK